MDETGLHSMNTSIQTLVKAGKTKEADMLRWSVYEELTKGMKGKWSDKISPAAREADPNFVVTSVLDVKAMDDVLRSLEKEAPLLESILGKEQWEIMQLVRKGGATPGGENLVAALAAPAAASIPFHMVVDATNVWAAGLNAAISVPAYYMGTASLAKKIYSDSFTRRRLISGGFSDKQLDTISRTIAGGARGIYAGSKADNSGQDRGLSSEEFYNYNSQVIREALLTANSVKARDKIREAEWRFQKAKAMSSKVN